MNTNTETTGQTHTNHCIDCGTELHLDDNWRQAYAKRAKYLCNDCHTTRNRQRMFVDGKYVPKSHPLWKAGRYNSFNDFASKQDFKDIKEGYVYVMTNDAWPDWVKIGQAVDVKDREKGYQTGSPFRDYTMRHWVRVTDMSKMENKAHLQAKSIGEKRNEWFNISLNQAKEILNGL